MKWKVSNEKWVAPASLSAPNSARTTFNYSLLTFDLLWLLIHYPPITSKSFGAVPM